MPPDVGPQTQSWQRWVKPKNKELLNRNASIVVGTGSKTDGRSVAANESFSESECSKSIDRQDLIQATANENKRKPYPADGLNGVGNWIPEENAPKPPYETVLDELACSKLTGRISKPEGIGNAEADNVSLDRSVPFAPCNVPIQPTNKFPKNSRTIPKENMSQFFKVS